MPDVFVVVSDTISIQTVELDPTTNPAYTLWNGEYRNWSDITETWNETLRVYENRTDYSNISLLESVILTDQSNLLKSLNSSDNLDITLTDRQDITSITYVPLPIEKTDNFDQWRQKCNSAIQAISDIVNANPVESFIKLNFTINNRDMLLYNSSSQAFEAFDNSLVDIVLQDYLSNKGYQPVSKTKNYYMDNLNNLF
jgi:hypothetical protein